MATVAGEAREDQLAWEARQRPRAGIAGIASAILTLGGYLWLSIALRDAPRAGFLESLGQAAQDGPIGEQTSLHAASLQFYVDKAGAVIGSGLVRAIGLLALAWVVTFLAAATKARRPELPRIVVYVTLFGAVLLALSYLMVPIAQVAAFNDLLDGARTVDDVRDLDGGSLAITGQLLGFLGQFTVAAGLMLVSLNAMRAGLLTRFLGILGVVAGILGVLPQLMPMPIVQSFWLVAVGLLLLGTAPRGGVPPAWRTGKAEPWPSAREAAEARREAENRRQGIEPTPTPRPKPEREQATVPAARPHPSSKKRKRKRRD